MSGSLPELPIHRKTVSGYLPLGVWAQFDGDLSATFRHPSGDSGYATTGTVNALEFDVTKGYAEKVSLGSLRFRFGGSVYVHTAGAIYRDPGPDTGAGAMAGSLNPLTGHVLLTAWTAGGANSVTLDACVTEVGGQPVDMVSFRTPISPVKAGTLQLRWSDTTGATFSKTPDGSGVLEDGDCTIRADWSRGIVHAHFGLWRTVASLTPEDLASDWYSPTAIINRGGVPSIWQSHMVLAESLIYNAVAATYLPPDSALLGLDAARLPPDGKALIYRTGMLALIHHTASIAKNTLLAAEVIDCGRQRLYRVVIEDANGLRLMPDLYTVNRELGLVTMADPLVLSEYEAPFAVRHAVADLQRIRETDINGTLTFLKQCSHDYPATDSYASGMLFIGTLQARYTNMFAQSSWSGEWSDTLIGDAPLADFSGAIYPIEITNAGAYPDRILVRFIGSTEFQVIGEQLGFIGVGDINTDCAPVNPLTSQPYFTIPYQGWGGGWATGNCLRFNIVGACYPVDCVRAVQPSDPTGAKDSVELLLVGNVDA